MKAKKGFKLRNVCGEHVIVAEGIDNVDFTNIISMNESSAYLWNEISSLNFFRREYVDRSFDRKISSDN